MAAPARLWKIRRIYLDRIGSPAARFRDVWLELTGRTGDPLDTIFWMRNGGGKSTLIALVCALIRPDRRDYLATAATGRHLEDCVLGADTAHIVVEWVDPQGRRMVTGAVYEWVDRIQPSDPNASHERLQQRWYAFTPFGPDAEIERLPFLTTEQRPTTLDDFTDAVLALPADTDAVVAEKQDRWGDALRDRGLDPGLFTAILKINATEGGIENQFKFRTADDFVQYLLTLVTDPTSAGKVSKLLRDTRERLARQPRLRTELDFTDEATNHLNTLAGDRDRQRVAADALRDQRLAAGQLATGFAAAAALAQKRADQHRVAAGEQREGEKIARGKVTDYEALQREYQWWAAHLTHAAALSTFTEAERAAGIQRQRHQAWQIVPTLVEHIETAKRLGAIRRQQQQAEADAEPARRARSEAAAVLTAVLQRSCTELRADIAVKVEASRVAGVGRDKARARSNEIRRELGGLETQTSHLSQQVRSFDAALHNAVQAGHLDTDADLHAAHEQCEAAHAAVKQNLDVALPEAVQQLRRERQPVETGLAELSTKKASLTREQELLAAQRAPLIDEINSLAADVRLTALAEADNVDPIAANRTLLDGLAEAMIDADRRRIDLAVEDAEDARAVQALDSQRGLLPASLDLARAAEVLHQERITATTGWHYLADAVPAESWAHAIAVAPHLVGGLLVHDHDDLVPARRILDAAELSPGSTVQVSTTLALQHAIDGDASLVDGFVVPPAPALFDRTAAVAEAERRTTDRQTRSADIHDLDVARERDLQLRSRLTSLIERCPPGHLEHLNTELARIDDAIAGADTRVGELNDDVKRLDGKAEKLKQREIDLVAQRTVLTVQLAALGALVEREPDAVLARAELAGIPDRRGRLGAELAEVEARENDFGATATREASDADRLRARLKTYTARCEELADVAADATVEEPLPTLTEAQGTYQAVHSAYTQQASASALGATIAELDKRLAMLSQLLTGRDPDTRAQADELVKTATAADPAALRQAILDAESAQTQADVTVGIAKADLRSARSTLDTRLPHRPAAGDLMIPAIEPTSAEEADRLLGEATAERLRWHAAQIASAKAATGLEARITDEERNATDLTQLVTDLTDDDAHSAPSTDSTVAFGGDIAEARKRSAAARKAISAAEKAFNTARNTMNERGHKISRWATEERFSHVTPEVRDRFKTTDDLADLAGQAESLQEQLAVYRHTMAGELAAIDKDKHLVVTALCAEARDALKTLQRAQNHAQLPPGLGDTLVNRRFLDVGPRASVDTSAPVMRSRIERLVDKLVQREGQLIPDGKSLTWEATSAAVGRGNFTARVLKPSTTLAEDRQPVELMSKWSGGEKVTISLLLFCMLARLRASNRGSDIPGLGVLPMDNPLGTANYVAFLDLQRRVAAANGIQLVFLSGLGDMRAVGRFPNVVRMKNTHNQGRSYAKVDGREINDDLAGAITTARLTLPLQETLL